MAVVTDSAPQSKLGILSNETPWEHDSVDPNAEELSEQYFGNVGVLAIVGMTADSDDHRKIIWRKVDRNPAG
jgi:hypothetical protein